MANTPMVEPIDPAAAQQQPPVEPTAPQAAPQGQAPVADTDQPKTPAALPDELLRIPAIMALTAGKPAALSGTIKDFQKRKEGKLITENKEPLMQAGFGFYRSLSGNVGVIFNQLYIHGDAIAAADKAGKLTSIAPPFDDISHAVSKAAKSTHPVLNHPGVPAGLASAPPPEVPQMGNAPVPPAPASVQNKLTAARLLNLKPSPPTGGAQPGAGALLNSILKPVV